MAASVWCEKEQTTSQLLTTKTGWVSPQQALESQVFMRKDVFFLSPLNYQQCRNLVWRPQFSNLPQGTPPCENGPAPSSLV